MLETSILLLVCLSSDPFLHCALNSSSFNLPSLPPYTLAHYDLVFPLWHSEVYFPTIALPIFPYYILILLLFVFFSLTWLKLHKIIRTEIAFPHMGMKEYIYCSFVIDLILYLKTLSLSVLFLSKHLHKENHKNTKAIYFNLPCFTLLGHKTSRSVYTGANRE